MVIKHILLSIKRVLLTLTTGLLLPFVALATIVLLPFSDRLTQGALLVSYGAYLGAVLKLAELVA